MNYFTLIKYGVPVLVGLLVGSWGAWKIQAIRLDKEKLKSQTYQSQTLACQDANKTCQATVTALKEDVTKAQKSCGTRLSGKEATISALRKIDALRPAQKTEEGKDGRKTENRTGESSPAVDNEGGRSSNITDGILDALNGMFDDPGPGGKDGVRPAADTGPAR